MKLTDTKHSKKAKKNFPVVALGTAAGGLDALIKVVKEIPAVSGMAYIILYQPSPDENLPNTLAQHSKIPVHEIINTINLVPDHIFIVPENNNLIAQDGTLKLHQRTRHERKDSVLDIFFEALAEVYQSFTIGVILSGTAFDGTFGFKKIKEAGGTTIAQDPETAEFKGMPQSTIDADIVDYVLAPELIPGQLLAIRKNYTHYFIDDEELPKKDEEVVMQIINLIFLRTGHDFHHYKLPTLKRRIDRRMVINRKDNIQDYYYYLRNDKTEQDLLFNDFLIPVTYFFRDLTFFESLPRLAFAQLVQNTVNNNLRIWVAGCSTGEEAYSIAITLHEYLTEIKSAIKVQIFASDISEKHIAKARTAIYSAQDVQHISPARLQHYFTKRDGHYHVSKVIRDSCIFAVHNFIKDPPFARIDLISCRNVLIYFDSFLQHKVLTSFHYSLREKGVLFLGKSESINNAKDLFDPVGKHEKIYARKFAPTRYVPETFKPNNSIHQKKTELPDKNKSASNDFRKVASDILFSEYTPASVIINQHNEIVHFHGDTSPFLLPSPGKPNLNILKMARDGISSELRNVLTQLKKEKQTVIKDNILVKNQPYLASFTAIPLTGKEEHYLILFTTKALPETEPQGKLKSKNADQLRIKELENELMQMREDLKRITEEQQTAFEELQTTNEELLSSSEELQAMNEELETSTEELQSNNEELICVNDELIDRQEQLISMRNYSESIFNTIREPLLIIDRDFFIKSANPAFYKYFETTEQETEGHSFFEIGDCQWDIPEFKELLFKMLSEKEVIHDFIVDTLCTGMGKKIMIVNARRILNVQPAGMILLAIEDITDLETTNAMLMKKNLELQKYNEQLETFSTAASHDLQEPLRKIQMFTDRITDHEKNLSESSIHNLHRISVAASGMSHLITDLINYSRIAISEKEYKKTDLNVLLKKTISDLKELILEHNAHITVLTLPQVNVIPFQIQQLFTNLLLNSMKYTKENVIPQIKIEAQQPTREEIIKIGGDPEISYVKICVVDNGIGFAKEYENKIFDPFYRLHSNEQYKGSGLGLTISKKIVSNHGGFITTNSKVNHGTTFTIYLPQ